MAEGSRSAAILRLAFRGTPRGPPRSAVASTAYRGGAGLHGARLESERSDARKQAPQRYVSPPTDAS